MAPFINTLPLAVVASLVAAFVQASPVANPDPKIPIKAISSAVKSGSSAVKGASKSKPSSSQGQTRGSSTRSPSRSRQSSGGQRPGSRSSADQQAIQGLNKLNPKQMKTLRGEVMNDIKAIENPKRHQGKPQGQGKHKVAARRKQKGANGGHRQGGVKHKQTKHGYGGGKKRAGRSTDKRKHQVQTKNGRTRQAGTHQGQKPRSRSGSRTRQAQQHKGSTTGRSRSPTRDSVKPRKGVMQRGSPSRERSDSRSRGPSRSGSPKPKPTRDQQIGGLRSELKREQGMITREEKELKGLEQPAAATRSRMGRTINKHPASTTMGSRASGTSGPRRGRSPSPSEIPTATRRTAPLSEDIREMNRQARQRRTQGDGSTSPSSAAGPVAAAAEAAVPAAQSAPAAAPEPAAEAPAAAPEPAPEAPAEPAAPAAEK